MTRQQLLDIIAQAAREGWTEIDLRDKGISELPDEIGQLTNLQKLVFTRDRLTTLTESIGQLTNLQSLNLSSNCLKSLPTSLARLEKLHGLDLEGNPLNAALKSAYEAGLPALYSYLLSLEEPAWWGRP
jgi:Leucine-rich repeat (LRR) protein